MSSIRTINVIETVDNSVQSIRAFEDTPEGNAEAEKRFTRLALDNGAEAEDMASYIEDGFFDGEPTGNYDDYTISLVHSE